MAKDGKKGSKKAKNQVEENEVAVLDTEATTETPKVKKDKKGKNESIVTKVITRDKLKEQVRELAANVKTGTVIIVAARKIKDFDGSHQMSFEIFQTKNLRGEDQKENILALFNTGDDRFNGGVRTVRVWLKLTEAGYKKALPQMHEQLPASDLYAQVGKLNDKKDQRLSIFAQLKSMTLASGEEVVPTISVKQWSEGTKLPKNIKKILEIKEKKRTDEQIATLEGLEMRNNDGELLVDKKGNQVYETVQLSYGEEDNVILEKMTMEEFENLSAKKSKKDKKSKKSKNDLADSLTE